MKNINFRDADFFRGSTSFRHICLPCQREDKHLEDNQSASIDKETLWYVCNYFTKYATARVSQSLPFSCHLVTKQKLDMCLGVHLSVFSFSRQRQRGLFTTRSLSEMNELKIFCGNIYLFEFFVHVPYLNKLPATT